MGRRRGLSDSKLKKPNSWATEEAIADDFKIEREFIFEVKTYSVAGVTKQDTRFNAFVESENNRASAAEDIRSCQNIADIKEIVARKCNQEEEAERNPDSFIAQKQKFNRLRSDLIPFILDPLVLASKEMQKEYSKRTTTYVQLLKPNDIPELDWQRAIWRVNAQARKQGSNIDYEVGNGRPPKHRQFGTPDRGLATTKPRSVWRQARKALEAPVKAQTPSGKEIEISRRELKLANTYRNAISANASARREFMSLIRELDQRNLLQPNAPMRSRKRKFYSKLFALLGNRPILKAIERLRLLYECRYSREVSVKEAQASPSKMSDAEAGLDQETEQRKVHCEIDCGTPMSSPLPAGPTRQRRRVGSSNAGDGCDPKAKSRRTQKLPSSNKRP